MNLPRWIPERSGQAGPERLDLWGQAGELLEVGGGERGQAGGTGCREADVHDTVIAGVRLPADETRSLGAVDELDGGVVPREEVAGQVPDGGVAGMAADGQEQLVLGRGEAGGPGLLLAPVQEPAQPVAEAEELRVLGVVQVHQ